MNQRLKMVLFLSMNHRDLTTQRCTVLALKIFLNSENGIMCRPLLMQLLTVLWKVQKWARMSKTLRIYSSSLLLAYDARRLRNVLQSNWKNNR